MKNRNAAAPSVIEKLNNALGPMAVAGEHKKSVTAFTGIYDNEITTVKIVMNDSEIK